MTWLEEDLWTSESLVTDDYGSSIRKVVGIGVIVVFVLLQFLIKVFIYYITILLLDVSYDF